MCRKLKSSEGRWRKGKGRDLEGRGWSRLRICAGDIFARWTPTLGRAREGHVGMSRRSSLHSSLLSPPRSLVGSSTTEVDVMIDMTFTHMHPPLSWPDLHLKQGREPFYRKHPLEAKAKMNGKKHPTSWYPRLSKLLVVTVGSRRIFVKVKRSSKDYSPTAGESDFMNLMPNPTPTRYFFKVTW